MEDKKLYNAVRKIITLADGRQIEIETGKLAKQADGSVVVKQGDTMLLATVVAAKDAKPDTDFMPLQVEYKEKYASCGRYPGGFMKREGRANDSEILVARLIDRALRPLFPADYHAEVYVTVNLISADKDIQPDALAGLAASAALAVSDIPFGGPISEVRVARLDGEYVINPKFSEMDRVDLDIMVGGTIDNILMVEGEMKEFTRKYIFIAALSLFSFMSGIMAFIDTVVGNFLHYFNKDYTSLYSGIYGYDNIVMNWLWLFLVYVMFCCLLYLTILIINKIGKTMSIYCGILFIGCIVLITALFRYVFSAELVKNILNFFMKAAGFVKGDTINYFYPSFSLLLIIGILGTTSFVVIRRTELK